MNLNRLPIRYAGHGLGPFTSSYLTTSDMSMVKPIVFNDVELAMLQELAKRQRLKPDQYLKKMVQEAYAKLK
jgi:hypothetical protein